MVDLEYIFEAENGKRILRGRFFGVMLDYASEPTLWWCHDTRRWLPADEIAGPSSNVAPCRSFKAFKRHVRKHHADLAGRRVTLVSRFIGHSVTVDIPPTPTPETPHD